MLLAQRHHQLLIRLLLARLVQHAHVRLTPIQGLGSLPQPTRQTIMDKREFEDTLEGFKDGHLTLGGGSIGGDFDLVGRSDGGGRGRLFSVRLREED